MKVYYIKCITYYFLSSELTLHRSHCILNGVSHLIEHSNTFCSPFSSRFLSRCKHISHTGIEHLISLLSFVKVEGCAKHEIYILERFISIAEHWTFLSPSQRHYRSWVAPKQVLFESNFFPSG